MSCDLGQASDSTIVAVLERVIVETGEVRNLLKREAVWPYRKKIVAEPVLSYELHLRYMRSLPRHSDYERIASGIVDRLWMLEPARALPFGEERPVIGLALDAGGVGRPVLNAIDRELNNRDRGPGPRVSLWPITATGGNRVTRSGRMLNAPKRDLVHAAFIELRTGRLRLGEDGPSREIRGLAEELLNFQMKFTARGHDVYEPWKTTQHDDRVSALALGCWAWQHVPMPSQANARSTASRA